MSDLFSVEGWASLLTPAGLVALVTLTALEIVLGIDNIVFISIITGKLAPENQDKARRVGLTLAMFMRIVLLLFISAIMGLTKPFFTVLEVGISGKDLILIIGGLFLIGKATFEMHERLEVDHKVSESKRVVASFGSAIVQILLLDLVFSLDSVITAVGMAEHVPIMVTAVVAAVGVMLVFSGPVARFVERHPTIKMLALAFLLLIGVTLLLEGVHKHVEKGYIYFAMAFSLAVELLNLKIIHRGENKAH